MKSKLFKLNATDLLRGLIVAVVTAILTGLYDLVQSGGTLSMKAVFIPGILAMLSYLIKNLFTNSNDQVLKSEK